ncbi:hypothetical protein J3R82DRAFT_9133 [Butyriboletus roseoflavus]|nr:hypothetical protein J3R82DRAFT_9133 [Butyriboletus roseoflavus]
MSSPVNPLTGTSLMPTNASYAALVATLVLLLSVSSAVVIRSLILRRRHHRLVEEAIRTGTWMPRRFDSEAGRRRRDIGQKPKLWEAWLHTNDDDDGESENEKRKWGDIMPVYAAYVDAPTLSPQGPIASSAENSTDPPSRPPRFIQPFSRKRSPPSSQPPASLMAGQALSLSTSSPTATPTPAVRIAVLIAMPGQSQNHSGDESGPPVVEIGIVEADVKDHETEISSRDIGS